MDGAFRIAQADVEASTFSIQQPGLYVLTEDLVISQANRDGLIVEADHVTIDLNGYSIQGPGPGGFSAIFQPASYRFLTVRNGALLNWRGSFPAVDTYGDGNRIEDVRVSGCARGIRTANDAILRWCAVTDGRNGSGSAITVGADSLVANCTIQAMSNLTHGIFAGAGSRISHCIVADIHGGANAVIGIQAGTGARVERCLVMDVTANPVSAAIGIQLESAADLSHSVVEAPAHATADRYRSWRGSGENLLYDALASLSSTNNWLAVQLGDDSSAGNLLVASSSRADSANGLSAGSGNRLRDLYTVASGVNVTGDHTHVLHSVALDRRSDGASFSAAAGAASNFFAANLGMLGRTNFSPTIVGAGPNAHASVLQNPGASYTNSESWMNLSVTLP